MHPLTAFALFLFLLLIYVTVAPPDAVSNWDVALSFLAAIGYAVVEWQDDS